MSDPTDNNYDDEDRHPRRRKSENPFDDIFKHLMNQFGGFNFENLFDQMDYFLEDIFRRFNVRTPTQQPETRPRPHWRRVR